MKISTASDAVVTTDISGGRVMDMTISKKGMKHIMGLLTNLYKDPQMAVIREYYTNALDAQTKAGLKGRPVLVSLPSWDNPVYEVQDFGVGMDEDDMDFIYRQYGESTKQDSNDEIGAFGLGCKAGLAIANQFTLVSNKNGKRTTCLISKTKSGTNTVTIVSVVETDAENGTTVKIPVPNDKDRGSNVNSFNEKARKFFQYSEPGLVLVDGEEPVSAVKDATLITSPTNPDFKVYLWQNAFSASYRETTLVMGNVPYVISASEQRDNLTSDDSFNHQLIDLPKVIPVPIGSIDLTPNREGVMFTDTTNEFIESVLKEMGENLLTTAQAEIEACKYLDEYWTALQKWSTYFDKSDLLWKGKDVPHYIKSESEVRTISRSADGTASHNVSNSIYLGNSSSKDRPTYLVEGASAEKYLKINSFLGAYMNQVDLPYSVFILVDDEKMFDNEWIPFAQNFKRVKAEDIITQGKIWRKAQRDLAKKQGITPSKIKYPVLDIDSKTVSMVAYNEIEKGTRYLFKEDIASHETRSMLNSITTASGSHSYYRRELSNHLAVVVKSKKIILIGGTRTEEAFLKRVPSAVSIRSEIEDAITAFDARVTAEVITHMHDHKNKWLGAFYRLGLDSHLKKIKDSEVAKLIDPTSTQQQELDALKKLERHILALRLNKMSFTTLDNKPKSATDVRSVAKRYPLITHVEHYYEPPVDHIVTYMNAVYKQTQDVKTKGNK